MATNNPNPPPARPQTPPPSPPTQSPPKPDVKAQDETTLHQSSQTAHPAASPSKFGEQDKRETMVTYVPQPGDPASVEWNGHTFQANKPVALKSPEHVAAAKSNPWFNVAGHDPAAHKVDPAHTVPVTSEDYRAYAVAWFKELMTAAAMKARWESEEGLRLSCGVGGDDIEYLNKLYVPRLAELTKAGS